MQLSRYSRTYRSSLTTGAPFGLRQYTFIYAIDAPDIGRIKFGKTNNVKKRFSSICGMSPAPLVLLGSIAMPEVAEADIFEFLKADRCHGEWFYSTEATRSIAALIAAQRFNQLAEAISLRGIVTDPAEYSLANLRL